MGTFRRYDCPHLMKGGVWCSKKAAKIINRTDITQKQKYTLLHKMTCSGCEVYKEIK